VFFQAVLLGGYAYAHLSTRMLGVRGQCVVHCVVVLLPFAVLPIGIPPRWTPPTDSNPVGWLLLLLTFSVGVPFLAVSTTAPLLQRWYAETGGKSAGDPYFLYATSNLGSMLALLGYPFFVEPLLSLPDQSRLWTVGYGLLVALVFGCAAVVLASKPRPETAPEALLDGELEGPAAVRDVAGRQAAARPVTFGRRLRWVALSAVPSSLLLAVTTYLTTEVASFPLLWVVPLALYLVTFMVVFSSWGPFAFGWSSRLLPWLILPLALAIAAVPNAWLAVLHLAAFVVVTTACHGRLAEDRPGVAHLTEFYFWMSLGGVLGGAVNALVAPVVFTQVTEYPLAVVAACLLAPPPIRRRATVEEAVAVKAAARYRPADIAYPAVLATVVYGAAFCFPTIPNLSTLQNDAVRTIALVGLPCLAVFSFVGKPIRFGL
ncbi:MAG: spermidine synthase, partial [Planctomycetia bacterium]